MSRLANTNDTERADNRGVIRMKFSSLLLFGAALGLLCASCNTVPTSGASPADTINVGQPEVFENADLQAQLDGLRQQLAAVSAIDQPSLISALSNLQGASATQSGASVALLQRGLPQVTTTNGTNTSTTTGNTSSIATGANAGTTAGTNNSTTTGSNGSTTTTGASLAPAIPTSAVPSAPALPSIALGSVGVLEQQLQLSSQIIGYQLLLTGSDFARYTTNGGTKDKLVIGFPITLSPKSENHDQAAEVEITYFPPNPGQFKEPIEFRSQQRNDYDIRRVCDSTYFIDANARIACLQQESSPTIVNILPAERSYNTVVLSSSANTFGLGALVGTVSVGASYGWGKQTQYLVAQQDTLALQKEGPQPCKDTIAPASGPDINITADSSLACDPVSRGVSFVWQFRPVLGSLFVRAGLRRMYVQLAIPYARRPYPNYGGIVQIRTRWRPFDNKKGTLADNPVTNERVQTRAVFGHPFIGPLLSDVSVRDLGSGNLLVQIQGNYLIGASVLVGSTPLGPGSPGFMASYNALQFTTTAQALAQNGAAVVASGGVVTPVQASSLCKYLDEWGECYRLPKDAEADRIEIKGVEVAPVSDSSSLVRVELGKPPFLAEYPYYRYFRSGNDVVGGSDDRKPDVGFADNGKPNVDKPDKAKERSLTDKDLHERRRIPIVITAGGKTYGFSDQPLFGIGHTVLSFIASNDSLNTSPALKVRRLLGDPASDSLSVDFIPPGQLQLTPFNHDVPAQSQASKRDRSKDAKPAEKKDPKDASPADAKKDSTKPAPTNCYEAEKVCEYLLVGALADEAEVFSSRTSCTGHIAISPPGAFGLNARLVRIPKCYKQLTLELPASDSALNRVPELIALPITAPPATAAAKNVAKTVVQTPNTPNFTLTRAVQDVDENQGVVYIMVGIQKLKDQSATLTVSHADIISATDGFGGSFNVQAGNQVTVTQDTDVIFALRNASPSNVNVVAEGKTGGQSTGKVTFDGAFNIARRPLLPQPPK